MPPNFGGFEPHPHAPRHWSTDEQKAHILYDHHSYDMGNEMATMHTSSVVRFKVDDAAKLYCPVEVVRSDDVQDRNNNTWQLALFKAQVPTPRGATFRPADRFESIVSQHVSLVLICKNNPSKMKFSRMTFIVRLRDGSVAFEFQRECHIVKDDIVFLYEKQPQGCPSRLPAIPHAVQFRKRDLPRIDDGKKFVIPSFHRLSDLLSCRIDGSLHIDVVVEVNQRIYPSVVLGNPNPLSRNMLKLLDSGDLTDVSFDLNGEIISAHKFILAVNAPILADLCKDCTKDTPLPITRCDAEVFRRVLRYIYGEDAPENEQEILSIGFDIIDAANYFGIVQLKLSIESSLVKVTSFNPENVTKYILFADAMTCPLLKERAVSYFVSRAKDIMKDESSARLCESPDLMQELMLAILDDDDMDRRFDTGYMAMPVEVIREKLSVYSLDLDGTKEVLASRLESYLLANNRE
jgi:hypothetical protein